MIIIDRKLGNLSDPLWQERARLGHVDPLILEQWEAPKSRLRKASSGGLELAISLPRSENLRDGDVLHYDEAKGQLVVAKVPLKDVLVIELEDLGQLQPQDILRICFELGHGLGNQHWPAVIKGSTVYVPLSVDQKVMASVMKTHRFEGIRYEFVPGDDIVPYLAPHESRRLFGGAEGPIHTHTGDRYVAVDPETGHVHGRSPIRAHAHPHAHPHTEAETPP